MKIANYEILAQIGAGRDGASLRALAGGRVFEVRTLDAARSDGVSWKRLVKRLRLAAMLDHPSSLAVRELAEDSIPPFVAVEWVDRGSFADQLIDLVPLPAPAAAALGLDLGGAIEEAHRLGLAHGRLSPGSIRCKGGLKLKVDFTGLATFPEEEPGPIADLIADCRAPESLDGRPADPAMDVHSLGALLRWLVADPNSGEVDGSPDLAALIRGMLAVEPADRPSIREVNRRLAELSAVGPVSDAASGAGAMEGLEEAEGEGLSSCEIEIFPPAPEAITPREMQGRLRLLEKIGTVEPAAEPVPQPFETLGRFRILAEIGRGGMGRVFRAEDMADGSLVAIKKLGIEWGRDAQALSRLRKEARLLFEVNNPYVANLLEINEDDGLVYLVLEYVQGIHLGERLRRHGHVDEPTALGIMADVARALEEAHSRGVVHRDIKPENILLVESQPEGPGSKGGRPRVKLSDFGLARHVLESESLAMTRPNAIVGTPLYMSPEQCAGDPVDAHSDVYAMGATLFHMLAGRPPFVAPTALGVIEKHRNEAPPSLRAINPTVSEGISRIIDRALSKSPDDRYADASSMLLDLERLRHGELITIDIRPRLPASEPGRLIAYDFRWELESSPRQLWPLVSNTERLNRAVGLPPVRFTVEADPASGPKRRGSFRKLGIAAAWEEHPFEWVEARRMGVLREYSRGPFLWLVSTLELAPRPGGGTLLTHRVRLAPRGLFGRLVAAIEVGLKGRRAVGRVYRRIDAALAGRLGNPSSVDPFEEARPPSEAHRRRIDQLSNRAVALGADPAVVERLRDYLAEAHPQELARIRPLALARRWGVDPDALVSACLIGAHEGLLILLWDLICPVCRISADVKDSFRDIREHGRCEACGLDFELNFSTSVEMIFRPHPEVREVDLGSYCIGGPAHSPHVVAQARIEAGARMELDLALAEGVYRLRGPQFPASYECRVQPSAASNRWHVSLSLSTAGQPTALLRVGSQAMTITNEFDREALVRLERVADRDDALTAAKAASIALFRDLFPTEVLSPGQLFSVSKVAILMTDLEHSERIYEEAGDARAFATIHEHFRIVEDAIRREGGTLVKTMGEGVMASFVDASSAARAGLGLHRLLAENPTTAGLRLRVGVHVGAAMAATINDHLDYFGATVNQAARLLRKANGGDLVLSREAAADEAVSALLLADPRRAEPIGDDLPDRSSGWVLRLRPSDEFPSRPLENPGRDIAPTERGPRLLN